MQPYTHALVGFLIGQIGMPGTILGPLVGAAAAVAPDLTIVPQLIQEKWIEKRPEPLKEPWPITSFLGEITHSLVVLGIGLGIFLILGINKTITAQYETIMLVTLTGWASHLAIDIFTHGGEEYARTDYSMMWPLPAPNELKIGQMLGLWEYRIKPGSFRPKPFEVWVCGILSGIIIVNFF